MPFQFGWENYLKGAYDEFRDHYHFLVTGSGRLDLYQKGGGCPNMTPPVKDWSIWAARIGPGWRLRTGGIRRSSALGR